MRDAAVPRARTRRVDARARWRPAAPSSCRRSSTRCRSGASPGITASRGIRRCRRSISCCWRAPRTRRSRRPAGAEKPALHPLVQRVAAAAGDARARSGVRRAGARGLRHDRSRASDGVQPAAAGGRESPDRSGAAPTCRSASWTTRAGTCRPASAARSSSKGPNVIRGYENNPEANAASFVDGWFRTGDQGFLDADGYLTLVGAHQGADQPRRREDLAARDRRSAAGASGGGRGRLLRRAACDVGRRSRRGRRRCAKPVSEADLLAYCSERLADFKRPKQIHITDTHSAHRHRQDSARRRREGVRAESRREDSSSPAPAPSAGTSARGWPGPAPTSCCSRADRICARCRSAACA